MKRRSRRATRPRNLTTTRRTIPGGGLPSHERVLPPARGSRRNRWCGAVVCVAAPAVLGRSARDPGRTPAGRGGGWLSGLHLGRGVGADRDHGAFGLRMPVLRVVRHGADARDPRATDRPGETALAVPAFPPPPPPPRPP